MDRHSEAFAPDSNSDPDDRSLIDDLRQLVGEGRVYAEAEFAYQRTRLGFAAGKARAIALLALAALALLFLAIMALVFGLVLALAPLVTAWGAMAIVAGALLLAALSAVLTALGIWRRTLLALGDEGAGP